MARAATKCSACKDLLWFEDTDPVPQSVICKCGKTGLQEDGPKGKFKPPTKSELAKLK